MDHPEFQRCMKFEGDETDIEYAAWLFKMLRDHGYSESKLVAGRHRETFRKAYALRLCERMTVLRRERDVAMKEAVTKTGTALMVVQNKLALRDAEFGKQKVRHQSTKFGTQGFNQGRAAAEKVNFNRPIGSSAQPRQLS
jgi:hypothetical protein